MVFVVISPSAFLILLIWFFSLLILVRFVRGLSILFIFSKNHLFVSLILCMVFLGAYRLIIAISFWFISPFISMECPSLSHLTNVGLKSTLSEISIATPAI
jgi:hypothetical protein